MASVRNFRDLIAWQKAMKLASRVYQLTRAMPPEERYGLVQQMRRCAVSVPSNIAEGHARQDRKDYLRFLRIARGSLAELYTQIELAIQLEMISEHQPVSDAINELERVFAGLIKGIKKKE